MFHLPFVGWDITREPSLPFLHGLELFLGIGDALYRSERKRSWD